MSESLLLIKAEELMTAIENLKKNTPAFVGDRKFKGFLICPSIDEYRRPVAYLNPVYGNPDKTKWDDEDGAEGDIIIQSNQAKACPYPPGYGSGS